MSAQKIRMATEEHAPTEERALTFGGDSLFAALRQVVYAGFPEMLPSIYPEHAQMLGQMLPTLRLAEMAAALRRLAHAPGIRQLRRCSTDPKKLVMTLTGAALAFSGPLDGIRPAQVTNTSQAAALAHLGLPPNDNAQYLDDIAAALRVSHDDVLAALAIVPQLPHLAGTLAAADRFTALPVAGIVFGLMLARG